MQSNLKLIISDAVQFFLSHLGQIAALCLPWLLATGVVEIGLSAVYQASEESGQLFLLSAAFKLLIYPVYTAALILLMTKRAQQLTPSNRELLSEAIKLWQPFFMMVLMIIALFGVASVMMISMEGFFQVVLSIRGIGVMLTGLLLFFGMARLSFAKYILVLDRTKPADAIVQSFRRTGPYFLKIAFLLAVFVVPLLGLNILLAAMLNKLAAPIFIRSIFGTGIEFLLLFVDVVLFRLYMSAIQDKPA